MRLLILYIALLCVEFNAYIQSVTGQIKLAALETHRYPFLSGVHRHSFQHNISRFKSCIVDVEDVEECSYDWAPHQ